MKTVARPLLLLAALAVSACAAPASSPAPSEDGSPALEIRAGLPNVATRLNASNTLVVAFVGAAPELREAVLAPLRGHNHSDEFTVLALDPEPATGLPAPARFRREILDQQAQLLVLVLPAGRALPAPADLDRLLRDARAHDPALDILALHVGGAPAPALEAVLARHRIPSFGLVSADASLSAPVARMLAAGEPGPHEPAR